MPAIDYELSNAVTGTSVGPLPNLSERNRRLVRRYNLFHIFRPRQWLKGVQFLSTCANFTHWRCLTGPGDHGIPLQRIDPPVEVYRYLLELRGIRRNVMHSRKWFAFAIGSFIAVSADLATAQDVVIRARPPQAVLERRAPAPGRGYVWTPGYQRWSGSRYVWVPGRWQQPPRLGARWVPYRWERRGPGWVMRDGHWR